MIRHGQLPYLECSSRGDKRFSAFYARVRGRGNRCIEDIYQAAKVFADGSSGLSAREAKGRRATTAAECAALYARLWDEYIAEHPELMPVLKEATGLSDLFGQLGSCCQATELWRIRNGGAPADGTTIADTPARDYDAAPPMRTHWTAPLIVPKGGVFVFGSNLAGRHGKGAALHARERFGARYGQPSGRQGSSYAIPTKDADLRVLPLATIEAGIYAFIADATRTQDTLYFVTRIGCGLAGYADADIKPFFKDAPPNVILPPEWQQSIRVLVTGGRDYADARAVDRLLSFIHRTLGPIGCIIHGDARGADRLAREWAKANRIKDDPYRARWTDLSHPDAIIRTRTDGTRFDAKEGSRRNQRMLDEGKPDLVAAFPGGPGTADMVARSRAAGLEVVSLDTNGQATA